jgi:hypothetical protein
LTIRRHPTASARSGGRSYASISTRRWRALGCEMDEEVFHNYTEIKAVTAAL